MNAILNEIQTELACIKDEIIRGNPDSALEGLRLLDGYLERRKTAAKTAAPVEELVGV